MLKRLACLARMGREALPMSLSPRCATVGKLACAVTALFCTVAAGASITAKAVITRCPDLTDSKVSDFGHGRYWTIDLVGTVSDGDDWTSTSATAEISSAGGGTWFQHPSGNNKPPTDSKLAA